MIRSAFGACLLVAIALTRVAAQDANTTAARPAVDSWLKLIDSESYASSWDQAASGFRNRVTSEQWQTAVRTARTPFGPLKSRTVKSVTATRTLPGAPDGEYVVFQFDAAYEHKAAAVETVTAVKDTDGAWRVAGYYVK